MENPEPVALTPEQLGACTQLSAWPTLARGLTFGVIYAGGALFALHAEPWPLRLLGTALAGVALHGISLFVHEAVHGLLSKSQALNRWGAVLCAVPVWQCFSAYRVLHLRHHRGLGEGDDPDHYPNYSPRRPLLFLMYWGRLLFGYPAYVVMIPVLGFRQANAKERANIALELALTAGVWVAFFLLVPVEVWLWAWALPMVVVHFVTNVRGMSQHTCLGPVGDPVERHPVLGTRSFASWGLTRFFMCNENFHLEHHLYPQVPWYHLPALHHALRPGMEELNAPMHGGYDDFVREFVWASVVNRPVGTVFVER